MTGETILLADDSPESVRFVRDTILQPNGYRVLNVDNGPDALQQALSQNADLLICKLSLPGMDGLTLLKNLRNAGSTTPVILTTAQNPPHAAARAFELGASGYLVKPFSIKQMLQAVDRALTEPRLRQSLEQVIKNLRRATERMEAHTTELYILHTVGQAIAASLEPEYVFEYIAEAAAHVTGAEESALMLLDEAGDLYLCAAYGLSDPLAAPFQVKVSDSIAGQVVKTGEPIIISTQDAHESFKVKTSYFVKSLINVPLKVNRQTIGVLAVNNKTTLRPFTNHHLNLLATLADYTAITIQKTLAQAAAHRTAPACEKPAPLPTPPPAEPRPFHAETMSQLGRLAANLAQEIHPSLSIILDRADIIARKIGDRADLLPYLTELQQETLKCRQTLDNLLTFAGQRPRHKEAVDLNTMLEIAWQHVRRTTPAAHRIEPLRTYSPTLPAIPADRAQLQQALVYILQTALNGPQTDGSLRFITRQVEDEAQLIITNSGHPLPAEKGRYLFDPFHQSIQHSYGLGFAIAYGIIEAHGGSIQVDSRPDGVTTFTLRLPAHPPDL